MEQTDLSLLARSRGDEVSAAQHLLSAYDLEAAAANSLMNDFAAEPTRSVLFRSAATLAHDAGLFAEAEKLIHAALAGAPPSDIAEELRDLLGQVNFRRHLELRGVTLAEDEIQMAITGNSVGYGVAPTDALLSRVRCTEDLLYRTAERKQNRPYRDRGRRDAKLAEGLELYMTVPRAACFAVTFRVGGSRQLSAPGFSPSVEVIDELLECLQLYAEGNDDQLRNRIAEEAYYRNFVGLARSIQPDGAKVDMVGFTTVRRGATKQVAMRQTDTKPSVLTPQDVVDGRATKKKMDDELVELRGTLRIADATKNEIFIITSEGTKEKVVVPLGMMSDIVKPLWDSDVALSGVRKGKKIHLMQIRPMA